MSKSSGRLKVIYKMTLSLNRFARLFYLRNNSFKPLNTFSTGKETHFGFENVSEEEKGNRVHAVFSNVADTYDVMNDVMSGGVHRLWKDQFVQSLGPVEEASMLDVAGGTGDIAFRYLDYLKNARKHQSPDDLENPALMNAGVKDEEGREGGVKLTVLDINESMLEVGRNRSLKNGHSNDISWRLGDAEDLPFDSSSFDLYTVAYGIRNMTHISKALSEAYRVLKVGGRFACLEFSRVDNYVLRNLYDAYSFNVIPVMGKLVAGDFNSYKYLVQSIRQFPHQEEFSAMIRHAGFKGVRHQNQLFGVSAIHTAFKI